MERITVYYHTSRDGACTRLVTTEKEYWDEKSHVDQYEESPNYREIDDALRLCGVDCGELSEYFLKHGVKVEDVVAKMRDKGFDLVTNPDFSKYCEGSNVVYYHSYTEEDETYIITTSKSFWDLHHRIEDEENPCWESIQEYIQDYGTEEVDMSKYVLCDDCTLEETIQLMEQDGFVMLANPDFKAYLISNGYCSC